MTDSMWCARCDLILEANKIVCACGTKAAKVPHPVDMLDLLTAAQALAGLMAFPTDIDIRGWQLDAVQDDMNRRDELMSDEAAAREATS